MATDPSLEHQRHLYREPAIIFALQLTAVIITGIVFYGIYLILYPYLTLPALHPISSSQTLITGNTPFLFQVASQVASTLILFFTSWAGVVFFFLILIAGSFLNELSYIPLGFYHMRVDRRREQAHLRVQRTHYPRVSVVIPAYNEEKTIEATVRSVLESSYQNFEVIVINDGSTDSTEQALSQYVLGGQIAIINRPQGGKALAVNTGILASSGEIVQIIDADVVIQRDVLAKLAVHFEDPEVSAVSGNIKVGNRVNVLTNLQALEYVRDLNLRRRALDILDTIPVIPGATGAFRKGVFKIVGGMDKETLVEDMDMTLKIVKAAGDVRFETHALSYTEGPENWKAWIRQRRRWYGGSLQTMLKHREKWWKFGPLSLIGFPFLIVSMFFIPIVDFTTMALLFVYLYQRLYAGVLIAIAMFLTLEIALSAVSIWMDKEDWRLILYSPVYLFFYRLVVDAVRMYSYFDVLRGRATWFRTGRYGELPKKIRLT